MRRSKCSTGWRRRYGLRFAVVFFIISFGLAAHSQIDAGAAHGALEVAGRDRRYYSLTPAGRKQLAPLRQEWRTFLHALDSLAGVSHA
jgi:hypothetical protein